MIAESGKRMESVQRERDIRLRRKRGRWWRRRRRVRFKENNEEKNDPRRTTPKRMTRVERRRAPYGRGEDDSRGVNEPRRERRRTRERLRPFWCEVRWRGSFDPVVSWSGDKKSGERVYFNWSPRGRRFLFFFFLFFSFLFVLFLSPLDNLRIRCKCVGWDEWLPHVIVVSRRRS